MDYGYIRNLVEKRGYFTFSSIGFRGGKKSILPAFILAMPAKDKNVINLAKDYLGIKNKVYEYAPKTIKDSYKRKDIAILIVRDAGQIKNIIIPLLYRKLSGYKGKRFLEWLEKMGSDIDVPQRYKFIYKLYKSGFYENNHDFD